MLRNLLISSKAVVSRLHPERQAGAPMAQSLRVVSVLDFSPLATPRSFTAGTTQEAASGRDFTRRPYTQMSKEELIEELLAAKDEIVAAKGEVAAAKGEVATITKELSTSQMSLQRIQPKFERISVRFVLEHAANLMRQDVGNEKLDMYSAVLMYLVADKKTAGFVQKGVFALVQKSHPGTPLKDVKRALEDLLRHANQPHHDIINDVFSVRYPDLVFQTTLQLAVFEAICREIGVDYRTVLKEALAPEAGGK